MPKKTRKHATEATGPTKRGFALGDHEFLHPSVNGPLSRLTAPKRQIRGAPPPTVLDGMLREATKSSAAAKALFKGEFCGHGEPTMTIFDVVIDGAEELDVSVIPNPEDTGRNVIALVARKPGGPWVTLYKREWEEAQSTLEGVRPAPLTKAELAAVSSDVERARVAIGFEYPCDATSRDCVSWMTIDLLFATKKKPMCLVDSEMA